MDEHIQPHPKWRDETKAAIVILWGLLIYPRLDPDLRKRASSKIQLSRFKQLFMGYLNDERQWLATLDLLKKHDYIRVEGQMMMPGTGLYISVDAAKMYSLFRSSVIARKLFQQMK